MKSLRSFLGDKRWLLLLALLGFALVATWCERAWRSDVPPNVLQERARENERDDRRREEEPLPDEFPGTIERVAREKQGGEPAVLRRVRTGERELFDRVVFDFSGGRGEQVPGYTVEYVSELTRKCGTDEVKVSGGTWLLVRMSPARSRDERGRSSVEGVSLDDDLSVVRQVRPVCESGNSVEWLIETDSRRNYRAAERHDPTRLVIDIKH